MPTSPASPGSSGGNLAEDGTAGDARALVCQMAWPLLGSVRSGAPGSVDNDDREMHMSLAAALKKGQAAIDTLGNWDPFSEAAAAAPKRSASAPAAVSSVPANVKERTSTRLHSSH